MRPRRLIFYILLILISVSITSAQNIAFQKVPTKSGSWNIQPTLLSNVVDGDYNTSSSGDFGYATTFETVGNISYIQIDFTNNYNLVSIYWKYAYGTQSSPDFISTSQISISSDNISWSVINTTTTNLNPPVTVNSSYLNHTNNIRYVRLSSWSSGGGVESRIAWYELQAILNAIPSVPNISSPSNNSRQYNNSINFTWNQSTDGDGDSITYDFWLSSQSDFSNTVNRTNFTNNWTGNIVTTDGVTYYGKVRSYDGYEYSNWSNVTQFTENTAPNVVNISLSPSNPTATDNLTISMNGTDAEGDTLTKYYRWYKNGALNTSWNDSTYVNATGNYTAGDQIYVRGYVSDSYENSSELQSNIVIIGSQNSAPVLAGITLNPTNKKYNKNITVSTSSNITDTESTQVQLQVYRYISGNKNYFGNSSWVTLPNNASVEITIPWSDGIAHTIYAQAQDNGNATQDPTTNLTSSEVSATFTSNITSPTVNSSSVSPSSVTTGSNVTITITADGKGANISSANVTITRPDYTSVTLTLTCTYTSGDISTCTRSYTANSGAGTYSIDSFGLADDSNNTAIPTSSLTFEATAAGGGGGGGGGSGGGTTIIIKETENATSATPLLTLKNITTGATEPQLQEISDCLTQSLFMENKCSGYNYGVVVEAMNWWVFLGAFFASFGVVIGKGLYQDKQREWYTEPLLYGTTTTLILVILVAAGFNMYLLNYLIGSPKYAWTFVSTALWGGIVALAWDNYYYGKKKYKVLRTA